MKGKFSHLLLICTLSGIAASAQGQAPSPGPDMIVTRTSQKSPDQVVDAVKAYAESKNWMYMGANKAKKGAVTMVKVCVPQVGQLLWPIGLEVSAFLPCGNLGVYKVADETQVSSCFIRNSCRCYTLMQTSRRRLELQRPC